MLQYNLYCVIAEFDLSHRQREDLHFAMLIISELNLYCRASYLTYCSVIVTIREGYYLIKSYFLYCRISTNWLNLGSIIEY
jgi:hypothetical protein